MNLLALLSKQTKSIQVWVETVYNPTWPEPIPEPMDWQPETVVPVHIVTSLTERRSYYDGNLNLQPLQQHQPPVVLMSRTQVVPAFTQYRSINESGGLGSSVGFGGDIWRSSQSLIMPPDDWDDIT
jgi:hypothetical protein